MILNNILNLYTTFIFDLDDTLYPEIEYLRRAYSIISNNIVFKEIKFNFTSQEIYYYLLNTLNSEGRKNIFGKLESRFDLKNYKLNDFLNDLRNAPIETNSIMLNPKIFKLLQKLQVNKKIFILTNGNPSQQQNKLNALDIPNKKDIEVIYASSAGIELQKPNPFHLIFIIEKYNLNKKNMVFIGDSETDREAASESGISFIYIQEIFRIID